jgi:hypothetical protein
MFSFLSVEHKSLKKYKYYPTEKNSIFLLISNSVIRAKGKVKKKVGGKIP